MTGFAQKYPPEWRAEDTFRLELFGEDTNEDCLWRPTQASTTLPAAWYQRHKKTFKVYTERRKFNEHYQLLQDAFQSKDSPFGLKQVPGMGLGVFKKKRVTTKDFKKKFSYLLCGKVNPPSNHKSDSHSEVAVRVRKDGKHYHSALNDSKKKKAEEEKQAKLAAAPATRIQAPRKTKTAALEGLKKLKAESEFPAKSKARIDQIKKEKRKNIPRQYKERNLCGPMVFVNHACIDHAQCLIAQRRNKGEHPFLQIRNEQNKTLLKKGEQLFVFYGDDYDGVVCSLCAEQASSATSGARKKKKRKTT